MITKGITFTKTVTMVTESCCNCGIIFGMLSDFREVLTNDPNKTFYCPNGHGMSFRKSKEQRLREEAERALKMKENELANIAAAKVQLESQLKRSERDLKRLKNGVCPCCNRTFQNLHNHIKKQHPELIESSIAIAKNK